MIQLSSPQLPFRNIKHEKYCVRFQQGAEKKFQILSCLYFRILFCLTLLLWKNDFSKNILPCMNEALSKCFGGLDIQSYFKHFAQQTILKNIFSKQFRSSFLDVFKKLLWAYVKSWSGYPMQLPISILLVFG